MKYQEKIKVPRFKEELGFYTTEERSKVMGKIRAKNTKPELLLRKALWALGYRYRVNVKSIPCRPDIVFRKHKLAIFVDGEFWHGHEWEKRREKIKTNRDFWIPKIERNIQRDEECNEMLAEAGWTVMRFWESHVKKELGTCLKTVIEHLEKDDFDPPR